MANLKEVAWKVRQDCVERPNALKVVYKQGRSWKFASIDAGGAVRTDDLRELVIDLEGKTAVSIPQLREIYARDHKAFVVFIPRRLSPESISAAAYERMIQGDYMKNHVYQLDSCHIHVGGGDVFPFRDAINQLSDEEAAELEAAQESDPATASNVAGDTSQQATPLSMSETEKPVSLKKCAERALNALSDDENEGQVIVYRRRGDWETAVLKYDEGQEQDVRVAGDFVQSLLTVTPRGMRLLLDVLAIDEKAIFVPRYVLRPAAPGPGIDYLRYFAHILKVRYNRGFSLVLFSEVRLGDPWDPRSDGQYISMKEARRVYADIKPSPPPRPDAITGAIEHSVSASGFGDTNQQVNQSSGDPDESDADVPDPHCARCRHLGTIFCTVCRWDPRNKYEAGLTDQSPPPPTPWDSRLCAV